ncbi:MAG: ABC transporter transmembrane domain-containing protein, partial [Cyanobacteria bacterium J06628_3]
ILVENRTEWLRPLILGMIVTAIFQGLLILLRLRYLRKLRIKLAVGMSSRFLWHLLELPIQFYAQRYAGEVSNRLKLNNKVAEVLSGQLATTVIDTVMILFYAAVMFAYDGILTLIGICFSAINGLALQRVARHRVDANMRLMQDWGKAAGVSIAALQSIETLKASALESDFFARWSGHYTKAVTAQQELEVTNQILGILPLLLTSLTTALILVVGGWRVMDGNLSIGMLIAFQSLMLSFQQPVNTLVDFGTILQELEGDLNRLDDVLGNSLDEEVRREEDTQGIIQNLQGYIQLKNITFGYSPVEAPLIKDFSLLLQPGQRIALVGVSGSGKSTIAKLICGLYQPWEGEILFDGIPRNQIPRHVLARYLSLVEQDIFIFGGTVRDNLTLWNPSVSDEQLIKACQDAEIHETIMSIPGG